MPDTCHCGQPSMTLREFMANEWSPALQDYCSGCAHNRCDAYPDDCVASKPWEDHWRRYPVSARLSNHLTEQAATDSRWGELIEGDETT